MQSTGEELDILDIFQSKTKNLEAELNQFMRYVSKNDFGDNLMDQLEVANQLVSVLRADQKLKPFSIRVMEESLELNKWSLKQFRNPQFKMQLPESKIRKIWEDYIFLHIDYASTMDDLGIPMWKIEQVMTSAHTLAASDRNIDAIIEILYYLEIYYREKPDFRHKAVKIQRIFDQMEERKTNKEKIVSDFFKELQQFSPSTAQIEELELKLVEIKKVNRLQNQAVSTDPTCKRLISNFSNFDQ